MNVTPDDVKTVGELLVLGALGGYGAWKARKAEKYAKPTGNGFAKSVKDSLDRIEGELKEQREQLHHHIQSHADADVANRPRRILRDVNEL